MKKLFGPNKDRMGVDQKAVLLVSKVNESKRHGGCGLCCNRGNASGSFLTWYPLAVLSSPVHHL